MRTITALVLLLAACSSAPPKDPPALVTDPEPPARERRRGGAEEEGMLEGAPAPSSSSATPAADPPMTLRGTATTTNTFGFGGDPYACNWTITMKSLVLDVIADGTTGAVESATFRAQAVEETLPPCAAEPYPPHEHVYTMKTAEALSPTVTRIELDPRADNQPAAAAAIDVDRSKSPATASIRIHRIDQSAPLDWTVVAKLTLEAN